MRFGEHEDQLRSLQKRGVQVRALQNKPEIYDDLTPAFNVWAELSRRRTYHGSGPNPIQLTELIAWLDEMEIEDGRSELRDLVLRIDDLFLVITSEVAKKKHNGHVTSNS